MPSLSLEETLAQVDRYPRAWAVGGFAKWAAVDRASGVLVGRIGLVRHADWPLAPDPVEVGWVLHPEWWGRGLATEGARAAVEVWRTYLDDQQLLSITLSENRRSRAVMERLGLTWRGAAHWRGREHVLYALDRD
jgi:RimJ/RimL family protein N-acetyltransferase